MAERHEQIGRVAAHEHADPLRRAAVAEPAAAGGAAEQKEPLERRRVGDGRRSCKRRAECERM